MKKMVMFALLLSLAHVATPSWTERLSSMGKTVRDNYPEKSKLAPWVVGGAAVAYVGLLHWKINKLNQRVDALEVSRTKKATQPTVRGGSNMGGAGSVVNRSTVSSTKK